MNLMCGQFGTDNQNKKLQKSTKHCLNKRFGNRRSVRLQKHCADYQQCCPHKYWNVLKTKLQAEGKLSQKLGQLKLKSDIKTKSHFGCLECSIKEKNINKMESKINNKGVLVTVKISLWAITLLLFMGCTSNTRNMEIHYFQEGKLCSENEPISDNNSNNTASVEEETSENSFVKETDWGDAKCKEYQEDDGYTNVQECIFPNANLQQVYNIVKKIDPNLKTDLPAKNIEYPSIENGCISVEYQYKSEKHLYIELFYNGGVTYVEIIENKNETQSKITYSAD